VVLRLGEIWESGCVGYVQRIFPRPRICSHVTEVEAGKPDANCPRWRIAMKVALAWSLTSLLALASSGFAQHRDSDHDVEPVPATPARVRALRLVDLEQMALERDPTLIQADTGRHLSRQDATSRIKSESSCRISGRAGRCRRDRRGVSQWVRRAGDRHCREACAQSVEILAGNAAS
jgi:hypothetical protein